MRTDQTAVVHKIRRKHGAISRRTTSVMTFPYRKVVKCRRRNLKCSQTIERKGLKDSGKELTLNTERNRFKVWRNVLPLKKARTRLRRISFPAWPYSLCRQQQMKESGDKTAEISDGDSTDCGSCHCMIRHCWRDSGLEDKLCHCYDCRGG